MLNQLNCQVPCHPSYDTLFTEMSVISTDISSSTDVQYCSTLEIQLCPSPVIANLNKPSPGNSLNVSGNHSKSGNHGYCSVLSNQGNQYNSLPKVTKAERGLFCNEQYDNLEKNRSGRSLDQLG